MAEHVTDKVTIYVDDVAYEVDQGQNLLHACLSHGLELPYFCWHPAMGSVGACRQCAVIQYMNADDQRGRLTMACMTPAAEGTRISISADRAEHFRATVIEWLMENHPHDCPVCEEGGECHLQDMTVMTGHTRRRYRGRKRTWTNQYLGPFINHEMNRCITCYRCVRFYRDYAGGTDLAAFGSRSRMYFGRETDGVLENEFSGNLVEVCPTGVFTDRPFSQSYTRKWDLRSAPSVCAGCAVGCNTFASERYGRLKRITNRYHGELNGYFLCDRGRFGAGFVNADDRIRHVGQRAEDGVFDRLSPDEGLERFAELLRHRNLVGIGSPRASMETNAALKQLVGDERYCTGMSPAEADQVALILEIYRATRARIASVEDVEGADAVLILGEDVTNTAPRIALALRQAVRNRALDLAVDAGIPEWQDAGVRSHGRWTRNPLCQATVLPTRLDDVTSAGMHGTPDGLAAVGRSIAAALAGDGATSGDFVAAAVAALGSATRPLVISGTGCGSRRVLEAAAAITRALESRSGDPALLLVAPEVNSIGSGLLGGGLDLTAALDLARQERGTLIVAENDLFRRLDPGQLEPALAAIERVVVLDAVDTPTASQAHLVFPAATFAEATGAVVNLETRAQRFYPAMPAADDVAPTWRWLAQAAEAAGRNDLNWAHVDKVLEAAAGRPGLGRLRGADTEPSGPRKVPRAPLRYSGRTAMTAQLDIHEPKTPEDFETPFSWSMEGQHPGEPSALLPFAWAPGWNSNQSVFKFQEEVGGAARGGDPGVRLLDAPASGHYPSPSEAGPETETAGYRLLPVHVIFGSDELSGRSPPIAERAPAPFAVLNPADAERLAVRPGDGIRVDALATSLQVRTDPAMREGCAGIAVGLTGTACLPTEPAELIADPDYRSPKGSPDVIVRG